MLKSKSAILIAVGVLLFIAIGLQFLNKQEHKITNAIKAIPDDAAIIIQTNNFAALIQKLNGANVFKKEFSTVIKWEKFFGKLESLDSLLNSKHEIKSIFSDSELLLSGHLSARNTLDYLFVLSLKDEVSENNIRNYIAQAINDRADIMQRTYEGYDLYDLAFFNEEDKDLSFSYSVADGLFICSFSKILTEEAIRRLKSGISLVSDKGFNKLSQTVGKNVDANIFINYKYFPKSLKNIVNPQNATFFKFIDRFASWTALDLILKKDAVLLSGYTYSDDSINSYMNVFKGLDNMGNDFLKYLPENTAAFVAVNIKEMETFKDNYTNYLKNNRKYRKIRLRLDELNNIYGTNVANKFYEQIEGTVSLANVLNKTSEKGLQTFGVFQLSDEDEFIELMKTMSKKQVVSDSIILNNVAKPVSIDTENEIVANKFPLPHLFPLLFGKLFNKLDAQYYMMIDDYIVTGKSTNALKVFYKKLKQGLTLEKNNDFVRFSNSLASESNIFLYLNFFQGKPLIQAELANGFKKVYSKNTEKFDKLQAVSLQLGLQSDLFFTNLYLNYNPAFRTKTKSAWEIQMDTLVLSKPQIVINHYTGNKEALVQDMANNLFLYGTDGKVLWKRHLPGKILGKVHQIDFYKNNKLQLLFNTKTHLFLIDRNGRDVENYPIKFKSPATNGMAVMDYGKSKNYRIFVACENKGVYLLNKSAAKVDGWQFDKTLGTLTTPVQHFSFDGKDYLIFSDEQQVYILNRRGETRIELAAKFIKSENSVFYFDEGTTPENAHFVTTGTDGVVYFIYLNGDVKKMTLGKFTAKHQFRYADIAGDGRKYFVYTDEDRLVVYNQDKSIRFEKKFSASLHNSLNLYKIGDIYYIGVSVFAENKIYLISPNGKILKGFPMDGASPFSVDKLKRKGVNMNIITGSSDNFLFNYSVHLNKVVM